MNNQLILQILKKKELSGISKEIVKEILESYLNKNKISSENLISRLRQRWLVLQPFPSHPEIMLVESKLLPGELGNAIEHLLGYYYIQEVSSMLSAIALDPLPGELVLDLCASPGSKSTQIASYMKNQGKSYAIKLGMIKAKGDYVMFMDSGMEIDPNGISMLLEHMEWYKADIIVGSKRHPVSQVNSSFQRKT